MFVMRRALLFFAAGCAVAGPPMPAYVMKAEDADAITAYLKSLP
jgi:hypothetical protein